MRETRIIMGMPITIEIVDQVPEELMGRAFALFESADSVFSTYRDNSEISRFNNGDLAEKDLGPEMREVFGLARETALASGGYFDMKQPDGLLDPSGIVKGWAALRATALLRAGGVESFCIDAGGDVQTAGHDGNGMEWRVGIRSPFRLSDVIKVVEPRGQGVATSGSYIRGAHIWNPHAPKEKLDDVLSITVIGRDILEADRFATAAFAMGPHGVYFIESLDGFEAYQVNARGIATQTTGFEEFVAS